MEGKKMGVICFHRMHGMGVNMYTAYWTEEYKP